MRSPSSRHASEVLCLIALMCVGCPSRAVSRLAPPRVYETGDCGAVMTLPGMSEQEVMEGIVSMGITAVQNRMRAKSEWNSAHQGHWVRWRLAVSRRDDDMRARRLVIARCDGRRGGALVLSGAWGASAPINVALQALAGGETIYVEGSLGAFGLVAGTELQVASFVVEAAAPSPAVDASAPPAAPAKPVEPVEPTRHRRRHRGAT